MPTAQQLRSQIESQLAHKIPSALTPVHRLVRETISTGIQPIDAMLGGGLPLGAISEITGDPSSGRTTFAMSVLANVCSSGHVCAWIDASDEFDPVSAVRAGIVLSQLLLVRCGVIPAPASKARLTQANSVITSHIDKPSTSGGSPHPRTEIRGLGNAVGELFRRELSSGSIKSGTPSAPNMRFGRVPRSEQANSDRMPPRRAGHVSITNSNLLDNSYKPSLYIPKHAASFEPARLGMEQALKVMDLLLHNGGFRVLVMDLASFQPEQVSMIPLATWFRFRALAEAGNASLVLLTQYPCAKSSAEILLGLESSKAIEETRVMTSVVHRASALKQNHQANDQRMGPLRKPPQSVQWHSKCAWANK